MKKPNNLEKSNLLGKINYSKSLLGYNPKLYSPNILIFKTKIKSQAKNIIYRKFERKKVFEVMDLNEFYDKFFK